MLILQPCSCEQHQDGATRVPASEPWWVGWGEDWGEVLTPQHTMKVWAGLAYSPETWSVCLPKHAWNLKNHNVDYHLWKLTFHTDRNRMQWWRLESILVHWGYSEGQRLPKWRPFARSFSSWCSPDLRWKRGKTTFPKGRKWRHFFNPQAMGTGSPKGIQDPLLPPSCPTRLFASVQGPCTCAPPWRRRERGAANEAAGPGQHPWPSSIPAFLLPTI